MSKIGVVQMNSGTDPERNLNQLKSLCKGYSYKGRN